MSHKDGSCELKHVAQCYMTLKCCTKIRKYLSSNTSCFNVCEATCFGPYMTIIRPICESS